MGKKKIRAKQQQHADALAASKPVMANQEGAEAAEQVHAGLDGESGQRWAHGDSRTQNQGKVALNESVMTDENTVGAVQPLADGPRFPRPGSLEIDCDGLAGSPAEMLNPGVPQTEVVDTAGQSLAPSAAQPATAHWASELADARQGAAEMLEKLTPAGDVDPFAGFIQSKGHRQGDTGQYAPIPGGSEVAEGDEVQTFDEPTRPGSAVSLRGTPQAPRPNSMGPMGAHSVVGPSIRSVGADAIESARS